MYVYHMDLKYFYINNITLSGQSEASELCSGTELNSWPHVDVLI